MGNDPETTELALGIDLGGTKVLAALVDADGTVIASHRQATEPEDGFDEVVERVASSAGACLDEAGAPGIRAAGVGVAGQVEAGSGVVHFAPNLDWHDVPLGATLEDALDLPVVVLNDVRAATWGEWKHGAARDAADAVVVFVGTGIGAGVVTAGRLLEGCTNAAAELGHMTIVADGRKCRCPNYGCFEAYAGGWGIGDRATLAAQAEPDTAGARLLELGGQDRVTAAMVTEAFREGDALATELVDGTIRYLAAGLTAVVNTFNPCTLVLGGGVIENAPEYVEGARPLVLERALAVAARDLRIVTAALGGHGGVIGAASYARHHILANLD